jgi:hypothetical protein
MKMLKLLKWDFLNFVKKYSWLYISFAIVFVITLLFPRHIHPCSEIVEGIGTIYSLFFYCYTMFVSAAVTIDWLRRDSAQLELSLPVSPGKLLLSKLILAVSINLSGIFLAQLLWKLIKKIGMSHIVLFTNFAGFFQYFIGIMVLLVILVFSYITAKSFNFTRNKARITTVLLSMAIAMLVMVLSLFLLGIIGVCDFIIKSHGEIHFIPNEKFQGLFTIGYGLGALGIILAGFCGGSKLLGHKFERY